MLNPEAMKLPDPLLVRFYRNGDIEKIQRVEIEEKTRHVTVKLRGLGEPLRFLHLVDVGWVAEPSTAPEA
jgi:hypothetical protein